MMTLRVAFLAIIAAASTARAETMRCGKWVVDSELSVPELIAKCGQPTSKEVSETDVRRPSDVGRGTVVVGKTVTERWLYDRGPRAFRMVVTIVDGDIQSIDHLP